jgi:hypothetical protein
MYFWKNASGDAVSDKDIKEKKIPYLTRKSSLNAILHFHYAHMVSHFGNKV